MGNTEKECELQINVKDQSL